MTISQPSLPIVLFAATTNPGKLRDFAVAASHSGVEIQSLPQLGEIPPPSEDETTFEGNARLKAEYYSRICRDCLVLADDSGLEVDALHGAPGVRSARFAEDSGYLPPDPEQPALGWLGDAEVDVRNNLLLLERMSGISNRHARYRCVLAVARDGQTLAAADGSVEGEILTFPRGRAGFGYDPLFWIPELARTMAEISLQEKHALSHRGRAFCALLPLLSSIVR